MSGSKNKIFEKKMHGKARGEKAERITRKITRNLHVNNSKSGNKTQVGHQHIHLHKLCE